jgi:hypothetical protein
MIMRVRFLLIGEGSSDHALIPLLTSLCIAQGAKEVSGIAPDLSRLRRRVGTRIENRISAALNLEPTANLVFIHRDADSTDPGPRYSEIRESIEDLAVRLPYVPVIPVQMTETWALIEEKSIRETAEKPSGKMALDLPSVSNLESISDPKKFLRQVLVKASGLSGRRLDRFKKKFNYQRRQLLENLDIKGDIRKLPAWQRLEVDTRKALETLNQK